MRDRKKKCDICRKCFDQYYFNKHKCIPFEEGKSSKICKHCKQEFPYASLCSRHEKVCLGPLHSWNDVYNVFTKISDDRLKRYVKAHILGSNSTDVRQDKNKIKSNLKKIVKEIIKQKRNCNFKWTTYDNKTVSVNAAVKDKNNKWKRERAYLTNIYGLYEVAVEEALVRMNNLMSNALEETYDEYLDIKSSTVFFDWMNEAFEIRIQRDLPR
jgi:hypothetical protein